MNSLKSFLNTPLKIGRKEIAKRVILAPMAGLTHIAFREILDDFGGYGLTYTEMCNARALPHENRYKSPVFSWRDSEAVHLVCQIYGSEPEVMTRAAVRIESEGLFGVDVNMGCSVAGICHKNAGAALLKDPGLALSIVRSIREAVSCPLIIKYRTGWEDKPEPAIRLAQEFEQAGVDALIFHPRVAPDRRSRPPKWEYIKKVQKAVSIPVFGNGNVFSPEDCARMLDTTNCAGIALGRMAIAKPWIFAEMTEGFEPYPELYPQVALKMVELLWTYFEPTRAIKLFKKFALYFCANFVFGNSILNGFMKVQTKENIIKYIEKTFTPCPQLAPKPNSILFSG
ncbi:tRNA-dihydrouridine synthase family protein [Desulfohalobiaceae bacterium Ax17]|uniref:tRNA dihydrouridine synthase n=1 Tax=Desulfovulcanus ferrireducens TaxID=2831190 RepID=UPI00207BA739|nr:tRNA-dihydrouridine synthase family protein [Desulfovulcanus ferrireducens]MBT8762918.1 tRNA-dihydrouridine synthase family protein [Desulfovulcanus ferrireducens]